MSSGHPFFHHRLPLAMSHRGFSTEGLENSMAAFAAAVSLGFRYVETDVHATSDGVAVAFHDATLDRVTGRPGRVAELPWSHVQRALIGHREPIPTVEELLGSWPDLRVNLDIKSDQATRPLSRAIERTRSHRRVCIASFSDARRRAVLRHLSAPVATSAGMATVAAFRAASALRLAGPARYCVREVDCLQVPSRYRHIDLVTTTTVSAVHAAGLQIHVWTVNDPNRMRALLDLGVDGIITDRADLLRDVLVARGAWSP